MDEFAPILHVVQKVFGNSHSDRPAFGVPSGEVQLEYRTVRRIQEIFRIRRNTVEDRLQPA